MLICIYLSPIFPVTTDILLAHDQVFTATFRQVQCAVGTLDNRIEGIVRTDFADADTSGKDQCPISLRLVDDEPFRR